MLLAPMSAGSIQQKRSFLEGKAGQQVLSPLVSITDDPLIPKAFGSRKFDGEGIAAKPRVVFENGVLRAYYVDKGMAPMIRALCQHTGLRLREIYTLFPSGPAKGACKVAGLPKPDGCV